MTLGTWFVDMDFNCLNFGMLEGKWNFLKCLRIKYSFSPSAFLQFTPDTYNILMCIFFITPFPSEIFSVLWVGASCMGPDVSSVGRHWSPECYSHTSALWTPFCKISVRWYCTNACRLPLQSQHTLVEILANTVVKTKPTWHSESLVFVLHV